MTSKERLHRIFAGLPVDRFGKAEPFWPHTAKLWKEQGHTAGQHPNDFFQMDVRRIIRIDDSLLLDEKIEQQTDEFTLLRDGNGVLRRRWRDERGVPETVERMIKTFADWKPLRHRLVPDARRFRYGYYGDYDSTSLHAPLEQIRKAMAADSTSADAFLMVYCNDPYEGAMHKLGDEHVLMMFADDPDFLTDMFAMHAEMLCGTLRMMVHSGVQPDGIFLGGDLAYNKGMLFSPQFYRELLMPHHLKIFGCCRELGIKIIYHTDGYAMEALPMLVEGGVDCLNPLEVQCGMDLAVVAKKYGQSLSFMGNLSVKALEGTKDQAVAEARRVLKAAREVRGYVFHSDHSVPPSVPFENYAAVMEVFDQEAAVQR